MPPALPRASFFVSATGTMRDNGETWRLVHQPPLGPLGSETAGCSHALAVEAMGGKVKERAPSTEQFGDLLWSDGLVDLSGQREAVHGYGR